MFCLMGGPMHHLDIIPKKTRKRKQNMSSAKGRNNRTSMHHVLKKNPTACVIDLI
jgi:SRSO17 transposase